MDIGGRIAKLLKNAQLSTPGTDKGATEETQIERSIE